MSLKNLRMAFFVLLNSPRLSIENHLTDRHFSERHLPIALFNTLPIFGATNVAESIAKKICKFHTPVLLKQSLISELYFLVGCDPSMNEQWAT
jgi:hypothetical protein